jgi:hypothetical protein
MIKMTEALPFWELKMSLQSNTVSTETSFQTIKSDWSRIFFLSGAAAVILLLYSLATMVLLIAIGGQPESAEEGFRMLQENRLAGLLRLDVLTILILPLYYLLYAAFYGALREKHPGFIFLAVVLGSAGVTLVLATPSAFSWLVLSDKFAAATSEAEKNMLLAAGEAILASDLWHGSGALLGGLLGQTAMFIVALLMLRSNVFSRATTWIGVITHGLDLLHILVAFLLPAVGAGLMFVAGPLYLVWFPLLARDFFRLGRANSIVEETI